MEMDAKWQDLNHQDQEVIFVYSDIYKKQYNE